MSTLSITTHTRGGDQMDRVMLWCVLAAGTAAAWLVSFRFWMPTFVVALIVMWGRRRASVLAVVPDDVVTSAMPEYLESAILSAVTRLPAGEARRLLGDVVRQGRALFGTTNSTFTLEKDNEARREAAELVLAACETALELSRVDTLLQSEARARGKGAAPRDAELTARYTTARGMFVQRLTDAASALGQLYASGVENGTPASDVVAELATDLSADAAARTAAKAEMNELLK